MQVKYFLSAFIFLLLPLAGGEAWAAADLTVLFSGSANGILRACYCPNSPWGGLAKRTWLVERLREISGEENVLLLDSGDLFPAESDADVIPPLLRLYAGLRYDAVAIGDQELLIGVAPWLALQPRLPWLSAGYRWKAAPHTPGRAAVPGDGARPGLTGPAESELEPPRPGSPASPYLAPPWMFKTVGGVRVGILSVVGPAAFRFSAAKTPDLELTDPAAMARSFLAANATNMDLFLILSHQGADADRALAATVDGIDVIIGGHSQSLLNPPATVNQTLIYQAGKNGENLGILCLWPKTNDRRAAPAMAAPPSRGGLTNDPFAPTFARGRRWQAACQLVPLDATVDEDAGAAQLIDAYYAAGDRANERRLTIPATNYTSGPSLVVENPVQYAVLRAGEVRQFGVTVRNAGDAPLTLHNARGKIRWLKALDFPDEIRPGERATILFELRAEAIDRFFRSEYSIVSDDRARVVVWGAINGRIEGPLPKIVDAPGVVAGLLAAGEGGRVPAPGALSRAALPAPAAGARPGVTRPVGTKLAAARVQVEFFYAAGCDECHAMEEEVLPGLTQQLGAQIELRRCDIFNRANYLRLAALQEKLQVRTSERVSIYIDERVHLGGLKTIKDRLLPEVEAAIRERAEDAGRKDQPASGSEELKSEGSTPGNAILQKRLATWTIPAIALAGLVDGVNPCAFATIIFFITLLAVAGKRGRDLLVVGIGFCCAVFATYFLLGYGAFHVIQQLAGYHVAGGLLRWGVLAVLVGLAGVSFKDAWAFRRSGDARSVSLQLPDSIKRRIHAVMRENLTARGLLAGSLLIGFLVTLIESVCTGQVYVPTLVYLSRHPELQWRALGLLALYNLAFVIPHIIIFVAAYRGIANARLLAWSRSNVVWSKVLMGVFFLGLALLLAWM